MARALATDNCWPQMMRAMPAKPPGLVRSAISPARSMAIARRASRLPRPSRWAASEAGVSRRAGARPWAVLGAAGEERGRVMSLPSQTIFRFAPSPNGRLHLGNAYSALYTDHWARALGRVALLRMEVIATHRRRPEFATGILEDLEWLGLSYPRPIRRQSDHLEEYHAGAERLREMGVLYPCFCSRSEIKAQGLAQVDPAGAPLYAGR